MSDRSLTDEQLRALCHDVEANLPPWVPHARKDIATFLREVAEAPASIRETREFQRKLWESEVLTSTAMGSVKVDAALDDATFRRWLATEAAAPLPDGDAAKLARLKSIFDRLVGQFEGQRKPWLKILRLLAVLFPREFTTLASMYKLEQVTDRLVGGTHKGPIERNQAIVARLDRVLERVATNDYNALAVRITLPWQLHLRLTAGNEERTEVVDESGKSKLRPLPAARRRKGLTAFKGHLQTMLAALQEVDAGITRVDFIDFLRGERPGNKDSSHPVFISGLQGEFGVIYSDGDIYKLTPSGRALLETGDPDALSEWLLTRVLGFDLGLLHLRDHGPISSADLQRAIQKANPGWTRLYSPSAITAWLYSLGLTERDENKQLKLTDRGRAWAEQIHWAPAILSAIDEVDVDDVVEVISVVGPTAIGVQKPSFEDLYARMTYRFPQAQVAELHAGLWANPRRHFAVLSGLSGAGKTQLALQYGLALAGGGEAAGRRVTIVPVQPGWYDPGPLLGYINPIQPAAYVRTLVLDFLHLAVAEPEIPHVLILDEMNLSRPEQYLAPLLSAMETGAAVVLHSEGDVHDGIECQIPYPSNLVIIGTVNMDETTHGLSDKVLDRAHTIEFWGIDIAEYGRWDAAKLARADVDQLRAVLGELMAALQPARLHFGWRVIDDVVDFIARNHEHGGQLQFAAAVDAIVYAKIVPKLRGDDSARFRQALAETKKVAERHQLHRCLAKLAELEHDLATTGSARFWR